MTTTIQLAALESSPPEGVRVTTAIAIASATSIVSALLFAVGIFVIWTYQRRWTSESEGDEVRSQIAVAAKTVPEIIEDENLPPDTTPRGENLSDGGLLATPDKQDDAVDSSRDGLSILKNVGMAEGSSSAGPSAVPEIIAAVGLAANVGSDSATSSSRENVLAWSSEDVQRWMDSVGFRREVVVIFGDHNIDGPRLLGLTDNILKQELGLESAALRSMILAVRARFFLEPRPPADAASSSSPQQGNSDGGPREDRTGASGTAVSSTAVMSEAMDEEFEPRSSGRGPESEAPPEYVARS
ncbi:hypothetical protein HDU96_001078 [Phlyctochytrium bullatum]|nr:hypothetical protein HDU96_001078 [Phlyctochytrium bullatum]